MAEWLSDEQANRTGKRQGSRDIGSPRGRMGADDCRSTDDDRLHGSAGVFTRAAHGFLLCIRWSASHSER